MEARASLRLRSRSSLLVGTVDVFLGCSDLDIVPPEFFNRRPTDWCLLTSVRHRTDSPRRASREKRPRGWYKCETRVSRFFYSTPTKTTKIRAKKLATRPAPTSSNTTPQPPGRSWSQRPHGPLKTS